VFSSDGKVDELTLLSCLLALNVVDGLLFDWDFQSTHLWSALSIKKTYNPFYAKKLKKKKKKKTHHKKYVFEYFIKLADYLI